MTTEQILAKCKRYAKELSTMTAEEQKQWYTNNQIELAATLAAAEARANILRDHGGTAGREIQEFLKRLSVFSRIQNLQIPDNYTWEYWTWINDITQYWVGRYSDFETEEHDNDAILRCIWFAVLYGLAGYDTKEKRAYIVTSIQDGKYFCYPVDSIVSDPKDGYYITQKNDTTGAYEITLNDKYAKSTPVVKTPDTFKVLSWRFNNIGNFVWYMQGGLKYLVNCLNIAVNGATPRNFFIAQINNKETAKEEELEMWTDPTYFIKPIMGNGIKDATKATNYYKPFRDGTSSTDTGTADLIESAKFQLETCFNRWGIPITSAKQQSLSADANLSVTYSRNICKVHDWRVKAFMKELGIEIQLEDLEMTVDNQNADKEGQGTANTIGDQVSKESE